MTLSQAIDWAIAGLQGQDVWTTYDAMDAIVTGLAVNWPPDAPLGKQPKDKRVLRTIEKIEKAAADKRAKKAAAKAALPHRAAKAPMLPPARPSRPQTGKGPFGR